MNITKVRTFFRPDRPRPYCVQWWVDGKVKTEAYTTASNRDTRESNLRQQMVAGEVVEVLTAEQVREYHQLKAEAEKKKAGVTVTLAVENYLKREQRRVDVGRLAPATFKQKKRKLNLFAGSFGGRDLASVTPEEVTGWIEDLDVAPSTYNDYRKHLHKMYEDHDLERNPIDKVETLPDEADAVGILTVEQAAKLFAYALKHHPEALGRLALEAFAGLRFSSAYRLEKADINYEDKGILLPRHKLKTKRRFYIDGLPDNLWLWLARTNDACWALSPSEWMHLKSKLFTGAKVPHPHNCLRHSFCTYHVAAHKNPGLTATLLCHTNQAMLWARYNGAATRADGLRYFSLVPGGSRARLSGATAGTSGSGKPAGTAADSDKTSGSG